MLKWSCDNCGKVEDHQQTIEFLEDNFNDLDFAKPANDGGPALDAAGFIDTLRTLKGMSSKHVLSTVNGDGTTSLQAQDDKSLDVRLPETIGIAIPMMAGYTIPSGNGPVPVLHGLEVRLRVQVSDGGKVDFRMKIQGVDRVWERLCLSRVDEAQAGLGALNIFRVL